MCSILKYFVTVVLYRIIGFGMIRPTRYGWGKRNRVVSGYLLHFVPRRTVDTVDTVDCEAKELWSLINLGRPMVLRRTAQLQLFNLFPQGKKTYPWFMVRKIESRPTFFLPSSYLLSTFFLPSSAFLEISLATGSNSSDFPGSRWVGLFWIGAGPWCREARWHDFRCTSESAEFADGWSCCEV